MTFCSLTLLSAYTGSDISAPSLFVGSLKSCLFFLKGQFAQYHQQTQFSTELLVVIAIVLSSSFSGATLNSLI